MEEKIKLNQKGYEEYLQAIAKKEKELADLRIYKGTEAIYQGDNWHDNPTLYQVELKEQTLMKEIAEMKHKLQNAELVENLGDDNLIDIGNVLKIDMIYSNDDKEEEIVKLVATALSFDIDSQIQEISVNSPLGKAIYHKKIGEVVTYKVKDKTFTIVIKEKII